jgi:selenocysteine-specific elongation factor
MIIGTAGHIDHGKTALVRALTGVDTDRLAEEKARGISIDLGFAYLPIPDHQVLGFVDVPGHERFIRNMLAGVTGIDFVLLVVAANDGVMPQTREHLAIIDLLQVRRGIVALTKADLAEAARRDEVSDDVATMLLGTGLAGCPIVPVSSVTGEGIAELRRQLVDAAGAPDAASPGGRFRLAVDRSFTLTGVGTIVTGTVQSGSISLGGHIVVSPAGLAARVRSIHAQNRPAEQARAGDRCALNLAGERIGKDAIARGDVVLDPDLHAPTERIDAALRVLATEPGAITQWMPARLHHTAAEIGARIVLLSETGLPPGAEGRVQLVLEQPIAAACGDRFILRDTSGRRTIGGGRFLDLRAPARRRRTTERLRQLDALAQRQPAAALGALLALAPVDLSAFARDHTLTAAELDGISADLELVRLPGTTVALSADGWTRFKHSLAGALSRFHAANPDQPGIAPDRLRLQVEPRLPQPAFAAALQALARVREVTLDGAGIRLPTHAQALKPEDDRLWQRIRPLLGGDARFRPPRVNEIAERLAIPEAGVRRLLKLLGRIAEVDEVAPDHFFLRTTVAEMVGIAADIAAGAANRQLTAAQFRDRLDNGRKVAIQILEFLDRHGVTLRRGDLRRINRHRLDLFQRPAEAASAGAKPHSGRDASPVGRPDFKSGKGRETVLGGFDPHSLPPTSRGA